MYNVLEYVTTPPCTPMVSGREGVVVRDPDEFENPGGSERDACEDDRASCNKDGCVDDVYWPGSSNIEGFEGMLRVAPTVPQVNSAYAKRAEGNTH